MKKLTFYLLLIVTVFSSFSQVSWEGGQTPGETDMATIVFDATGTPLADTDGIFYAHTGVTINDTNNWQNVIGDWGSNTNQPAFTLISGNIYHLGLSPNIMSYYGSPTGSITGIDIVVRSADGNTQTTDDLALPVGAFQVTLTNPANSITVISSGSSLDIMASNIGVAADYNLIANGVSIHTQPSTSSYTYTHSGITENQNYELQITQRGVTIPKFFNVIVNPGITSEAMPAGMENGINYNDEDATTATLVLDAPGKEFVYVAGSFNSYNPTSTHLMKQDSGTGKFWLTLTGLTSGQIETYQYWVGDQTLIANSPELVKTADPFSTLVLSPFDDPHIPSSSYPSTPAYPTGQEREVTVLQTGQSAYNWQVTNFTKPKKEDLIIYEVLIRDFDADRNFQDLIDKINYFKNLNINAIQLMPVMEFEGNESWGYNTAFHLALDKFYGTEAKFKELIDLCHQNGIAVILDVALNHAFGRNPMNRMWMKDDNNDGWGNPSSENPYFNETAKHSYNVGSDFNHQQTITQYYAKRVIKHWIEEFKIDGFRWDLTKGFTQNCTSGDDMCTNSYQQDRVDILKNYADYSWSLDATHYVIFEHLGNSTEETEWANHRADEGKGIMLWGKVTDSYNQLTMGYNSNNDINKMGHLSRGFNEKRLVGYSESHDEERLMYKNLSFGNSTNTSHNVKDLNTALSRMSALGAVSLTIPGPKMIWHFADLGMENSIFTCDDGTVNDPNCKLNTKPQPQWTDNWLADTNRNKIYNDWARLNFLKINEDVFEGNYSITTNTLTPKIYIWDDEIPDSKLKSVVVLANFEVTNQNIIPNFPYTGTWYDLMDKSGETSITVVNTETPISIAAGQFKIYGNKNSGQVLTVNKYDISNRIQLYPNPANTSFSINRDTEKITIFDVSGRTVKSFEGNFNKGELLDISSLSIGIYYIRIHTPEGFVINRLIISN